VRPAALSELALFTGSDLPWPVAVAGRSALPICRPARVRATAPTSSLIGEFSCRLAQMHYYFNCTGNWGVIFSSTPQPVRQNWNKLTVC
jgi:hypothetical protein